ncbi:DUF3558 domain-containing protein [Actinophytocola glycyrrhizae]|uniref:DUF3558 domain-containing protein n=1 Tax=Actinophytocola glycyrrhizae TaxID=2044873 RepID=A0ABV9RWB7_9PSEU
MNARVAVAGLVTFGLMGVAGCTTSTAGTATPRPGDAVTTTDSAESTEPSSEPEAPRVADPLDATRFLTDPCAVLTPAQLATFKVSRPGKPDTDSEIAKQVGPLCSWRADTEIPSSIGVTWQRGNKNGLGDLYRIRDRYDYFEPTTVDGYPAVFRDSSDARADGDCLISVGVSDSLTFTAGESGTLDAHGACDRAAQVAAAVLATLKESR